MRPKPKIEYTENGDIIWNRKVIVLGWCVLASFIAAVYLVTIGFYIFG